VTTAAQQLPLFGDSPVRLDRTDPPIPPVAGHSAATFEDEFSQLYRGEFPRLFRYLDRALGDDQLASDLVQEAFTRLLDRGRMPDEPTAWLITVVNNLVRDHFRKSARRLRLLSQSGSEIAPGPIASGAEASVDSAERRGQVRTALDRLAERDRSVLLLRHSGYSYREIATSLGLTETAVGTILLRASARFRTAFKELHGEPD